MEKGRDGLGCYEVKNWAIDEAHRIEQETWQGMKHLKAGGGEDRAEDDEE